MEKIILVVIKKAPLLTETQMTRLASICADIAQVSLGSIIIPFLFDRPRPLLILLGSIISMVFWITSILLERKRS